MKKNAILILLMSTLYQSQVVAEYNIVITKEHSNYKENKYNQAIPIYKSCKEILDNGLSIGDGIYEIKNNDKTYDVRCDMTSNGGGWTMVFAQYETDTASSWDEGIQSDYDPSLLTKKSFSLNTSELPDHNQVSFSQTDYDNMNTSIGYFEYVYTTGEIPKTLITMNTGQNYHIFRSHNNYYAASHDPDFSTANISSQWNKTLTIDITPTSGYNFAFSMLNPVTKYRGYAYGGDHLYNSNVLGAWILWVR